MAVASTFNEESSFQGNSPIFIYMYSETHFDLILI